MLNEKKETKQNLNQINLVKVKALLNFLNSADISNNWLKAALFWNSSSILVWGLF